MAERTAGRPALLVTLDTEEEGLWSGVFRNSGNTVENTRGIPRFQELCDRYEVPPTYLVDTPVVEDDRSAELLSGYQNDGRCEIGAHLHAWCTPPFEGESSARSSYLCNLPPGLQRAKITHLAEQIAARSGRRPSSFRAGRYGLDATGVRLLAEAGFVADSSVTPLTDHSGDGGPDFERAPTTPYYPSETDIAVPAAVGAVLEVPVTIGFNVHDFARARRIRSHLGRSWLGRAGAVGFLDRLGILRRTVLNPERFDAKRMAQLVDVFLARRSPCAVLTLHSSSLRPGHNPYVPDGRALERLYASLEGVLEHCRGRRRMGAETLTAFARRYRPPAVERQG